MHDHKIKFDNIEWEHPSHGVKQKMFTKGNKTIRLVRFDDTFKELDWCTKGHIGYVLDGEMNLELENETLYFQKGDGLWINELDENKHKTIVSKGKFVELLLFEDLNH